ncbi:two-component sensor histidine kinase [Actinomyces sp. HMT 175]|nr:two-component sensor histidine kinase [Actinomyces sp. HMT 175]
MPVGDNAAMSLSDPTSSVPIRRNDVLLALTFTVVQPAVAFLASTSVPVGPRPWFAATAIPLAAEGLALVLWRSRPLVCQALVWSAEVATSLLLPAGYVASGYGQLVVSFSMGMRFPLRRTAAALTALSLAYSAVDNWRDPPNQWELAMTRVLVNLAACLLPMLGGAALASSRRYEHSRQELLRREHGRQLEVALIQERRRLAGELHDVAAHHLAGIVVQAAALERLIDRDPQTARDAAQQLRRQAKETLSGLRSVVGLLRSDEEAEESSPGLRDLPELVASTRALGVDVELLDGGLLGDEPGDGTTHTTSSGAPSRDTAARIPVLSQRADTAIFRVAQQAISNALQHAPGAPITVEVRRLETALELTVLNGPAHRPSTDPGGGGTGLTVMRERADAVGGSLHAGPVEGGGWRVRLVLPLAQGAQEEDA